MLKLSLPGPNSIVSVYLFRCVMCVVCVFLLLGVCTLYYRCCLCCLCACVLFVLCVCVCVLCVVCCVFRVVCCVFSMCVTCVVCMLPVLSRGVILFVREDFGIWLHVFVCPSISLEFSWESDDRIFLIFFF